MLGRIDDESIEFRRLIKEQGLRMRNRVSAIASELSYFVMFPKGHIKTLKQTPSIAKLYQLPRGSS